LTTLVSFDRGNGFGPNELIQATDGNFYGTTQYAGGKGDGTVFKMTPKGKLTTLYRFCRSKDCDSVPFAGLVQGTDGNFYGTTTFMSHCGNCGTVFKITPTGTLTTLFKGLAKPTAAMIQATDGNFYGTTELGGANGDGTVFQIMPAGTLTTLYDFCSQTNCTDGEYPIGLVQSTNGNFYGVTTDGGAVFSGCPLGGCGTVYSLSVGLGPFVSFVRGSGKVGWKVEILGQGFRGTTGVSFNGTAAHFVVHSHTYLTATVPQGATTGFVSVTTPGGTLQSNVVFRVTK
jgi:uncharacterized repeat protein (TIGR03803 family)